MSLTRQSGAQMKRGEGGRGFGAGKTGPRYTSSPGRPAGVWKHGQVPSIDDEPSAGTRVAAPPSPDSRTVTRRTRHLEHGPTPNHHERSRSSCSRWTQGRSGYVFTRQDLGSPRAGLPWAGQRMTPHPHPSKPVAALLPKQTEKGWTTAVFSGLSTDTCLWENQELSFFNCLTSTSENQPTFLPLRSRKFFWVGLGPAGSCGHWMGGSGGCREHRAYTHPDIDQLAPAKSGPLRVSKSFLGPEDGHEDGSSSLFCTHVHLRL